MKALWILFLTLFAINTWASDGLTIHTSEFGVGKFHRYDNKVHTYAPGHAWAPFILADHVDFRKPAVVKNTDGSFSVFYSTLDELISSVVKISHEQNQKVSVLNIHGHGLPGTMWFPKDLRTLRSPECSDWISSVQGSDEANYEQYYSAVSVGQIMQVRAIGNSPGYHMSCTTGLSEWQEGVAKNKAFLQALNADAQIHFLSCVVGLGPVGETFTKGLAKLFFPQGGGQVETSMAFGLGDWSMHEGMSFWDYQSQKQVEHDNLIYVVNREDREIMQKGNIRIVTFSNNSWQTGQLANQDFMSLGFVTTEPLISPILSEGVSLESQVPKRVRVPGTNFFVAVIKNGDQPN